MCVVLFSVVVSKLVGTLFGNVVGRDVFGVVRVVVVVFSVVVVVAVVVVSVTGLGIEVVVVVAVVLSVVVDAPSLVVDVG